MLLEDGASPFPAPRNMIDHMISHYRVVASIGAGRMGKVYRATDTRLGRDVALKVLPVELAQDPQRLARFRREARTVAALNHPNIVTLHSVGEADGIHFLTMELVEGRSLDHLIPQNGFSVERTLAIAITLSDARVAAHERGIVHRDLKPANVMVTKDGRVKVLDFGLAKEMVTAESTASTLTSAGQTAVGAVIGTPAYMSPEQVVGSSVDHRTDLFSLGIVIYEMACGRRPFEGVSPAELASTTLRDTPCLVTELRSDLPDGLARVIQRCLEKDPRQRVQTARDVGNEIRDLERGLASGGPEGVNQSFAPAAGDSRPAVGALAGSSERVSIAVLPFSNISNDPDNEYFCDGMAEELLNALSKIEALRVAARTSAFSFKGKQTHVREIGQKLDVVAVLEGSVRKAGNRLRIMAQLVSVADGYQLWSECYERQMEDIFDIQDEISLAIVDALRVKLLGAEKAAVLKRSTENTEAYQLYLKGRYQYSKYTEEGFRTSIQYYEQAIEKEPEYAPAFAALSITCVLRRVFGFGVSDQSVLQAKTAATRALALDQSLAESHFAHALVKFYHEWDWSGSEREYQRAIKLKPNLAEAHERYAVFLAVMGRSGAARVQAIHALDLAPVSLQTNYVVGWAFGLAGELGRMLEQGRMLTESEPGFVGGHVLLGYGFFIERAYERAVTEIESAVALGAAARPGSRRSSRRITGRCGSGS